MQRDASVSCHIAMQRLYFKNGIIAVKIYRVMILNLYLTSAQVLMSDWGGCTFKCNDEGF